MHRVILDSSCWCTLPVATGIAASVSNHDTGFLLFELVEYQMHTAYVCAQNHFGMSFNSFQEREGRSCNIKEKHQGLHLKDASWANYDPSFHAKYP